VQQRASQPHQRPIQRGLMAKFGQRSISKLVTAHPLLQRLMNSAIADTDFSVICGYRGPEEQDSAYAANASKLRWPKSKHNSVPSMAVDIVPHPLDWKDIDSFKALALVVKRHWELIPVEERSGTTLSWGGDWKKFKDYPHWEIK